MRNGCHLGVDLRHDVSQALRMAAAGRTIHDLAGKLNAIADVLFEAGRIRSRSIRAVAAAAEINYNTLKAALQESRISTPVEERLCTLAEFSADEWAWRDGQREAPDRRKSPSRYDGRDTAQAFRSLLREKWLMQREYRARTEAVHPLDDDLACHEFSDCQQRTTHPSHIQLFFEASFGVMWCEGVRYGLRTARVNLCFSGPTAGEFVAIFARDAEQSIKNAHVVFAGTTSLPCWQLRVGAAGGFLEGLYRTTDAPFVTLDGYADGMRLRSVLCANLNDSFVSVDPTVGAISENQRALIEVICAGAIPEARRRSGVVELCSHEIILTEVKHAEAA